MDPTIRLEPARAADAGAIARMSRDLIERGLAWRWRPEPVRELMGDSETAAVVARQGRAIQGFAIMSFDWERSRSRLVLLAVDPTRRRQGIGAELVRWLEVVARRGGVASVVLEVRAGSHAARHFYRSLGYRETGRVAGYYQGREDAVKLIAWLRARTAEDS